MRKTLSIALAAAAFAVSLPAAAQFAKPEDAIKYRKSALFVMQQNFGRVAAMANGRMPFDARVAAESADTAAFMIRLPWAGFVAGSDKGDTKAKPEIWAQDAKFKELQQRAIDEMSRVAAAAKTGNIDQIKAAAGQVGSCKACHDAFRE